MIRVFLVHWFGRVCAFHVWTRRVSTASSVGDEIFLCFVNCELSGQTSRPGGGRPLAEPLKMADQTLLNELKTKQRT